MLYFAYGSNLLHQRLQDRIPCAQPLLTGVLKGHRLAFHKIGSDGSGKCDAYWTAHPEDRVFGAIFRISPEGRKILDQIEGLGHGYADKLVNIETEEGIYGCFTYVVMPAYIDPRRKPFFWYHQLVLAGAIQNRFPTPYIEEIRACPYLEDPNTKRTRHHLALIRAAGLNPN